MTRPEDWLPLSTAPTDGTWVLVRHPNAVPPAIARPVVPGSDAWENFWGGVLFIPAGGWLPIPEAWYQFDRDFGPGYAAALAAKSKE